MKIFLCFLVVGMSIIFAGTAPAQLSNNHAGAFLRFGAGARASALGGAFTGIADDASAAYWNAAGLGQLNRIQVLASFTRLPFDRNFNFVSGMVPFGKNQVLGFSWLGLQVTGLEARSNNTAEPDFQFSDSENAFFISYADQILPGAYFGASLKLLYIQLARQQAIGSSFDAGFLIKPVEKIQIGIVLKDLASAIRWPDSYREYIPTSLRAGIAYAWAKNLKLSLDIAKVASESPKLAWGVEFNPIYHLPLRLGFGAYGMATGAGFELPMDNMTLKVDYGFSRDALVGNAIHQISLQISFFQKKNSKSLVKNRRNSPGVRGADFLIKNQFIQITAIHLNVRRGPGLNFQIMTKVYKGQKFAKIAEKGNWIKIKLSEKRSGWIHKRYVLDLSRYGTQ